MEKLFTPMLFLCIYGLTSCAIASRKLCKGYSVITSNKSTYYINGLFPVYTSAPSFYSRNGLLYSEIVKFTIAEANKNSSYKIGYRFYDTCGESQLNITTNITMDILLNPPWFNKSKTCTCSKYNNMEYNLGVVGPASSSVSQLTSNLLSVQKLPLISYVSTSPSLSNRNHFPYFQRTIPDDLYQANVILDMLLKFKWKYVSLIASDNIYGRTGSETLKYLFSKHGICLGVSAIFSVPYDKEELMQLTKQLQNETKAEVIIVWALGTPTKLILGHAKALKLYNRTWIFTEALADSITLRRADPKVVCGSFTIRPVSGTYPEFEKYFFSLNYPTGGGHKNDSWLKRFFHTRKDSINATVGKYQHLFYRGKIGFVRNSIMAYIVALKDYVRDFQNSTVPYPGIYNRSLFYYSYISKVNFTGLNGEIVTFDEYGNISGASYDILNIRLNTSLGKIWFKQVGTFRKYSGLDVLPENEIVWSTITKPKAECSKPCPPGHYPISGGIICCWNCLKCEDGFIKLNSGQEKCTACPMNTFSDDFRTSCLTLTVSKAHNNFIIHLVYFMMLFGSAIILIVLTFFCYFRNKQIVKASSYKLSVAQLIVQLCLTLTGLTLTFEITIATCMADAYSQGFFFSILLSIVLIKADFLLKIFSSNIRMAKRDIYEQFKRQIKILLGIIVLYVAIHILLFEFYRVEIMETKDFNSKTINRVCVTTAQTVASAIYILLLSMICSVQTFRNRKLPSLYNEGKVIMYAVFILTISITLILMIQLVVTAGKRSLITFICLYASNLWLLTSMFLGKVYRMLFRVSPNQSQFTVQSNNKSHERPRSRDRASTDPPPFCVYD